MGRPAKKAKLELLSDSDESDADSHQGVKLPSGSGEGFKINSDYAKRFEHNKKREDLHRLEEKYGKSNSNKRTRPYEDEDEDDEESSTDEEEDDDADLVTADLDDEWMDTLRAIKSKDPRVYNKDIKFYKDFDPNAPPASGEKQGKDKPMTLQDYHRQNLMSGYTGGDEDADAPPQTYDQEQDALRREMVGQMHAMANGESKTKAEEQSDDEDDDFKPKAKGMHESMPAAQTQQSKKAKAKRITDTDIASADKDPETYLSNFMAAQAWRPKDSESGRPHAFDSDDSDEDARADAFEEAYNMRFEDPALANERLQTFARDTAKYSVRRDEATGRKKARERERERKEAEKREREEDRARLRRLKIEAAEEKVKKIREAAGLRGKDVDLDQWRDIIEGDFDDADWDKEMTRRFGESYYAADEGAESDEEMEDAGGAKKKKPKKPKWDDDIDIKDLVPDFEDEETARKYTLSDDDDDEDGGAPLEPEDEEASSKKKKSTKKDREKAKAEAKRAARKDRAAIESMVDASLPLNNSSLSTNTNAGFRYRETSPTNYGLSARDILFADDSALNQFAGLKKLATWRDEEKKRRDKKKFSKKGRLRQWRKETFGKGEEPVGGFETILGGETKAGGGGEEERVEGNVKEGERKRKRSKGKKRGEGAAVATV